MQDKRAQALPKWFSTAERILNKIRAGRVDLIMPDGRVFTFEGPEPGPSGVVEVKNPALFRRLVWGGELGVSESYIDGWWDSPDLQALLDVFLKNDAILRRELSSWWLATAFNRVRHWLNSNSKAQARKNISFHYDLGNKFYERWLDPSMTYSSALYDSDKESLEQAQIRKYASVCDLVGSQPGDHLLEIGCGWGGMAEFAAKHRGLNITGLTISKEQFDFASERMFREGLNEKVDIVLRDYRDETGQYDGVVSIEMFEAVGERYWPVFFNSVRDRLQPGAQATMQIITVQDQFFDHYRRSVDFIQKYIFPGGMLPSPTALQREIDKAGLVFRGSKEFGQSYSTTLREWFDRFNGDWEEIAQMGFDDRFRRIWNFYLASCAACFRYETTDVTQITMARPS